MWTCPRCHQKFINKNQSHSCGHYSVRGFLRGKSVEGQRLFRDFIAAYRRIGTFELHPVKTRVALLTKIRFASVNKVGADYIDVHFVLTSPFPARVSFRKVENLANKFFIHHLRIARLSDITPEVRRVMKAAYRIGLREHVETPRNRNEARMQMPAKGR